MTLDRIRANMRSITALLLGALLLALAFVTIVDVVGRYFLSQPLPGGKELTELLMMGVVFAGLPAITLDDGHVTADLFLQKFSDRGHRVQLAIARALSGAALLVGGWQLWAYGARVASYGQTTVYLKIPLGPVAYAAALVCIGSGIMVLLMAFFRVPRTTGAT